MIFLLLLLVCAGFSSPQKTFRLSSLDKKVIVDGGFHVVNDPTERNITTVYVALPGPKNDEEAAARDTANDIAAVAAVARIARERELFVKSGEVVVGGRFFKVEDGVVDPRCRQRAAAVTMCMRRASARDKRPKEYVQQLCAAEMREYCACDEWTDMCVLLLKRSKAGKAELRDLSGAGKLRALASRAAYDVQGAVKNFGVNMINIAKDASAGQLLKLEARLDRRSAERAEAGEKRARVQAMLAEGEDDEDDEDHRPTVREMKATVEEMIREHRENSCSMCNQAVDHFEAFASSLRTKRSDPWLPAVAKKFPARFKESEACESVEELYPHKLHKLMGFMDKEYAHHDDEEGEEYDEDDADEDEDDNNEDEDDENNDKCTLYASMAIGSFREYISQRNNGVTDVRVRAQDVHHWIETQPCKKLC